MVSSLMAPVMVTAPQHVLLACAFFIWISLYLDFRAVDRPSPPISSPKPSKVGVPQGSVFGSLLLLHNSLNPIHVDGPQCLNHFIFLDAQTKNGARPPLFNT